MLRTNFFIGSSFDRIARTLHFFQYHRAQRIDL